MQCIPTGQILVEIKDGQFFTIEFLFISGHKHLMRSKVIRNECEKNQQIAAKQLQSKPIKTCPCKTLNKNSRDKLPNKSCNTPS